MGHATRGVIFGQTVLLCSSLEPTMEAGRICDEKGLSVVSGRRKWEDGCPGPAKNTLLGPPSIYLDFVLSIFAFTN